LRLSLKLHRVPLRRRRNPSAKAFEVVPHLLAQQLEHCCGLAREAARDARCPRIRGRSSCPVLVESPPRCSPRS
jgi:hypothetical protein